VNERLAGPVDADGAEDLVLHGVPLRRAGRIVRYTYLDAVALREALQLKLPLMGVGTVGAARVSEDQELPSVGIAVTAIAAPPPADRVDGERRGVAGGPDDDEAVRIADVVDPVRDRYAVC